MVSLLALLLLTGLLVASAVFWKRLLGLAVSRFAHGTGFRLTIGEFFFAGVADVRLLLHVGPVRELRISHLSFRLASASASDAAGGALWQAMLAGQLLLPISLRGVSVRLAAAPAGRSSACAPVAASPAVEARVGAGAPAQLVGAGSTGGPASGSSADGGGGGQNGAGKKARPLRAPLALLAHLPVRIEGLTVLDEERGLQLRLQLLSLSLLGAQQLLLEGLGAGLLPGNSAGSGSGSGGRGSAPTSPSKQQQQAAQAAGEQHTFLQVERLLLEHTHDGSFCMQDLQLRGFRAVPGGSAADPRGAARAEGCPLPGPGFGLQRLSFELGAVSLTVSQRLLLFAQQQKAAVSASARQRGQSIKDHPQLSAAQHGATSSGTKQDSLLRLLALLPRVVELAAESCTIATDSGGSSSGGGGSIGGSSSSSADGPSPGA